MGIKDLFTTAAAKEAAAKEAAEKEIDAKVAAAKAAAEKAAAKIAAEKAAAKVAAAKAATAAKAAAAKAASEVKSLDELAKAVIRGDWGNGQERKDRLTSAGHDYSAVQGRVNEILKTGGAGAAGGKSVEEIAREVIRGNWGNGQERKDRLTAAGYDYSVIQKKVNELL